ncbi:hypothetical protein [Bacillus sp. E(2018)]|uniref:hypothetical protein n=1 Tax=Bacillus sp. E(2018) TaxID=2502239 RepID=UPI002570CB97|nr:hypothetical protein [Bacillus sp. E(2018)]
MNELYSAMINATRQGENISPLYFNAEAYKTSSVFQMRNKLKTQEPAEFVATPSFVEKSLYFRKALPKGYENFVAIGIDGQVIQ